MIVITEAEKVLCEELKKFSKEKGELVDALLEGSIIVTEELNIKESQSSQKDMLKLRKALDIDVDIEGEGFFIKYATPDEETYLSYWDYNEKEITQKELCYVVMRYQREVEKITAMLRKVYERSSILVGIEKDLEEIIKKYVEA